LESSSITLSHAISELDFILTGMVFYLFFCIFLAQPSVPVKEKMVDSGDEDYDFDTDLM
jgi:hypothetical protein